MKFLSIKELVKKYGLKNEATYNVKTKEILQFLNISRGIYMRDDKFATTAGIVNLHSTKGTHLVRFTRNASGLNEKYFDSYGCPPPVCITKQIIGGIYSEYQIEKNDSYCAAYCLYVLYLANMIGF